MSETPEAIKFHDFLETWNEAPSIGSEDIVGAILPLFEQVVHRHSDGQVAPLHQVDKIFVQNSHLYFPNSEVQKISRSGAVTNRQPKDQQAIQVVEEVSIVSDDSDELSITDISVSDSNNDKPQYLTNYRSWEVEAGHHDELTDIFGLGMLMASLATGLDFTDREQLETFVRNRNDLQRLNSRLHPVLCRAIERMTVLERFDRAQDLPTLILTLENHRQIGSDFEETLNAPIAESEDPKTTLLKRLRARLYDTSRRNRLVYHRPIAGELNLTETSVPLVINLGAIREADLFTAKSEAMKRLIAGKEIVLGDYLRFEEMLFAPSALGKLRADAARDEREFGSSPLRLVPVMLHWYDLKNAPDVAISSPLLLMSVTLKRRKGVRDAFTLSCNTTEVEVNPALSYVLEQLYGIKLPTTIDIADPEALPELHRILKSQIIATEPGVTLNYSDKPKMRLLHRKVRRRLDTFNKRRRTAVSTLARNREGLRYSYNRPGYDPFGVKLFQEYVSPAEAPLRDMTGRPLPRLFNRTAMVAAATEKDAKFLQHVEETTGRFDWSFNLCSVMLANFNYRKMSLVRDYNDLLKDTSRLGEIFDLVFGSNPRPIDPVPPVVPPEKRYMVMPSDPTQNNAVLRSRTGQNYVIQGPPGTGKSQTITNLIAEYLGRKKRVLFVCEKRAALDVVHNRLRGTGLGAMSALFHDSQGNRREFIADLATQYNNWMETAPADSETSIERDRQVEFERIVQARADIRLLTNTMTTKIHGGDMQIISVLSRALQNPLSESQVTPHQAEMLPSLKDWTENRDNVQRALAGIRRSTGAQSLVSRAERHVAQGLWADDDLVGTVEATLAAIAPRLGQLAAAPVVAGSSTARMADAIAQVRLAARLVPAAETGQLQIFSPQSPANNRFRAERRKLGLLAEKTKEARAESWEWNNPLTAMETENALRVAEVHEGRFLRILSGVWRRTRADVMERIQLQTGATPPSITALLTGLQAVHLAEQAEKDAAQNLAIEAGFNDFSLLADLVDEMATGSPREGNACLPLLEKIKTEPEQAASTILALAAFAPLVEQLLQDTDGILTDLTEIHLSDLPETVTALQNSGSVLRSLQPVLSPLATAPAPVWHTLTHLTLGSEQIEAAVTDIALKRSFDAVPGLDHIDAAALATARNQILLSNKKLVMLNAKLLQARAHNGFRENVAFSNTPTRDLDHVQRQKKTDLNKARRALEHEFGKTRAYRSPRELLSGPARPVLLDLKPVWLMSPLSVADVLPLDTEFFDVVIFDEASQILVEDALPTFVRAPQTIVVGDDKQLPPTDFFNSSSGNEDFDEDDTNYDFELSQESFLTLSAEKMSSTMLGWHYRSRSEELISFSNAAFYGNRLLTVPAPDQLTDHAPIHVADVTLPPLAPAQWMERPISFHMIEEGIYSERRNSTEATYIAHCVRDLLALDSGKTIGIVAFSQAQQQEIEAALEQLASNDPLFSEQLDMAQEKEEDGEFTGLFVKNLENVQGDERDVIFLSICYAPGHNGKMRMNFGPINKMGGEKRLNVIFSRARENMVVVSSIQAEQITNDYNTGARTLKAFLTFAESISQGREEAAKRALNMIMPISAQGKETDAAASISGLAENLRKAGFDVREGLGMSGFKIDLALKPRGAASYKLAVLIDTSARYTANNVESTWIEQAGILKEFGWEVMTIPLKDIWRAAESVQKAILACFPKD